MLLSRDRAGCAVPVDGPARRGPVGPRPVHDGGAADRDGARTAAPDRYAGIAVGVNNAVARAAGLLAVATLPLAAGLGTGSLTDPAALGPVYRTAMLISAGLLLIGAVTALVAVPSAARPRAGRRAEEGALRLRGRGHSPAPPHPRPLIMSLALRLARSPPESAGPRSVGLRRWGR